MTPPRCEDQIPTLAAPPGLHRDPSPQPSPPQPPPAPPPPIQSTPLSTAGAVTAGAVGGALVYGVLSWVTSKALDHVWHHATKKRSR